MLMLLCHSLKISRLFSACCLSCPSAPSPLHSPPLTLVIHCPLNHHHYPNQCCVSPLIVSLSWIAAASHCTTTSILLLFSHQLAGCCVALLRLKVAADVSGRWWRMIASYSKIYSILQYLYALQHFTAFYSIYSILQHCTAFYSICTLLQHFTAFYSNLQYLYVLTAFYSICTYFTAFYSILQHLYVHTCSCRREARSWDMR